MNSNQARASTISIPHTKTESRPVLTQLKKSNTLDYSFDDATPPSGSFYDNTCRCCGKQNCENLDYFSQMIRKLESDTRLAAEIGQGLLNKHESYVNESNQQKQLLQRQLSEYQDKIYKLEHSLDDIEYEKSKIIQEKNKWHWEYQKRQKILDETLSDLESANDKCSHLTKELDTKCEELEQLRLFKFMIRNSESREEALVTKLEDTNQELIICRKHELLLESKIKKLKTKYENLCNSHESLLREFEDRMKNALTANSATHRYIQPPSNIVTHTASDTIKYSNTNDLIDVIKELSLANTKLKLDLMNCKDQLSEAKGEIVALNQKMEDMNDIEQKTRLDDDLKPRRTKSVKEKQGMPIKSTTAPFSPPVPTISASVPTSSIEDPSAIHHHYHYYVKKNDDHIQITDEMNSSQISMDKYDEQMTTEELVLSPSLSPVTVNSPFIMLQEHVTQVLERLRGSDIRALNRRLKRAFDITELSSMSNSIIDNILMEIDTLESRFLWVKGSTTSHDGFFPLLNLLKDMLTELGVMKSTMNDLQVEYVKKVEESEVRVEEEILRKRQQTKKQSEDTSPVVSATKPLSWITNMFYKSTSTSNDTTEQNTTLTKTITDTSTLIASPEDDKRRYFPQMSKSTSTGTVKSISNRNKRTVHRMNIDYEGIGPATIRPIVSDM